MKKFNIHIVPFPETTFCEVQNWLHTGTPDTFAENIEFDPVTSRLQVTQDGVYGVHVTLPLKCSRQRRRHPRGVDSANSGRRRRRRYAKIAVLLLVKPEDGDFTERFRVERDVYYKNWKHCHTETFSYFLDMRKGDSVVLVASVPAAATNSVMSALSFYRT